jgi:hypothetical protein
MIRKICNGLMALGLSVAMLTAATHQAHAEKIQGFRLPASFGTRNCTQDQRNILQKAADEAKRLLIKGGSDAQFTRWFGVGRDGSQVSQDVQGAVHYVRIYALESLTSLGGAATTFTRFVTFDCFGGRNSSLAHVTGPFTGVVFIDNNYWTVPDRPSLQHVSKASVIIHELSHLAGTGDFAAQFGYTDAFAFARDLALLWPAGSPFNADNHEYFYNGE